MVPAFLTCLWTLGGSEPFLCPCVPTGCSAPASTTHAGAPVTTAVPASTSSHGGQQPWTVPTSASVSAPMCTYPGSGLPRALHAHTHSHVHTLNRLRHVCTAPLLPQDVPTLLQVESLSPYHTQVRSHTYVHTPLHRLAHLPLAHSGNLAHSIIWVCGMSPGGPVRWGHRGALTAGPPPRPPACNCHGHARDCYYDPEVDRRNASQNQDHVYQGGGVCIDCQVGGAGAAAPAPGMGAWGDGAWGDGARAGGGAAPELTALRPPSITPLASTVSSVCPASTAPRTTPWTRPTPAAVSGVRLSGAAWERHPGCPGAGSVGRGGLGPGQLSGRPGHGSHPPSQVGEADTAPPPRPHSPRVT